MADNGEEPIANKVRPPTEQEEQRTEGVKSPKDPPHQDALAFRWPQTSRIMQPRMLSRGV